MSAAEFKRMHSVLRRNLGEYGVPSVDFRLFMGALAKDKKNLGSDLVCILASRPGHLEKVRLQLDDTLRNLLRECVRSRIWAENEIDFPAD
jgi:3-dehydroquinate synthetase